jgi:hypothetical protein
MTRMGRVVTVLRRWWQCGPQRLTGGRGVAGAVTRVPGRRGHPAGQGYGDEGLLVTAANGEGAAVVAFQWWGRLWWSPTGSAGSCSTGGEGEG